MSKRVKLRHKPRTMPAESKPGLVDAARDTILEKLHAESIELEKEVRLERVAEALFTQLFANTAAPSAIPLGRDELERMARESINAAKTFLETLDLTVINNGEPQ